MKFFKGLHTDNHPSDQPESSYRGARNVVLKEEEQVLINEAGHIATSFLPDGYKPIGYTVLPDGEIIVFSASAGGNSEIGVIWSDKKYYTLINDSRLNFSVDHPIDAIAKLSTLRQVTGAVVSSLQEEFISSFTVLEESLLSIIWDSPSPSPSLSPSPSAGVFYTDFSEYETGELPNDWTRRHDTAGTPWEIQNISGATGDKVLRFIQQSTVSSRSLSWDVLDIPGNADVEIEYRSMGFNVNANPHSDMRSMIRGSGGVSTRTMYNGGLRMTFSPGQGVRMVRYENDSATTLDNEIITNTPSVWYRTKIRVVGADWFVKVWLDSEAEPEDWTISGTDSSPITGDGWIGLSPFDRAEFRVDWFKATIL
jgi:hypothetical protein